MFIASGIKFSLINITIDKVNLKVNFQKMAGKIIKK